MAESVGHSVSAFFKNRKQNKTNSSPQIFNQTFYFLLAFKAFAESLKFSKYQKLQLFVMNSVMFSTQLSPISVCQQLDFFKIKK